MPATKLPHSKATGLLRVSKGTKSATVRITDIERIEGVPIVLGHAVTDELRVKLTVDMSNDDFTRLLEAVRNG